MLIHAASYRAEIFPAMKLFERPAIARLASCPVLD
jgi:hypothetical protein